MTSWRSFLWRTASWISAALGFYAVIFFWDLIVPLPWIPGQGPLRKFLIEVTAYSLAISLGVAAFWVVNCVARRGNDR